jgi:hypothetical protein
MKFSQFFIPVLALTAALASGCATLKVDQAKVREVKKVAIIALSSQQEFPPGIKFGIGSSSEDHGANVAFDKESPHMDEIYANLRKLLQKDLKWQVLEQGAVTENPGYVKAYKSKKEGLQAARFGGSKDSELFRPTRIMDWFAGRRLEQAERDQLIKDLKVDAVVVAEHRVALESKGISLLGSGDFSPQSTLVFSVFRPGVEDPIWDDLQAKGDAIKDSTAVVLGVSDNNLLKKKSVMAADNAHLKLFLRYREETEKN